jgi:uncharacterized membrane protein YczE
MLFCSAGVSAMFHTYISPEVYELFVKEVSERYSLSIKTFKLVFDLSMLSLALVMLALLRLPLLDGVGVGTVICALLNSPLIALIGGVYDKFLGFEPGLPRLKAFLK